MKRATDTDVDFFTELPTYAQLRGDDGYVMTPPEFQWPCVTPVQDQGSCGACWAFASVATLADRFRVFSDLATLTLSPYKMLACNFAGLETDRYFPQLALTLQKQKRAQRKFGCAGNSLQDAWRYLFISGVPELACVPFLGRACKELVGPNEDTCTDGAALRTFRCSMYYAVTDIEREIYLRGPVSAAMRLYDDFWTHDYTQVYTSNLRGAPQGHAVRIVGWGESAREGKWWLVYNSFGVAWGLNGTFRIRRGTNECAIESNVIAGLPDAFGSWQVVGSDSDLAFRARIESDRPPLPRLQRESGTFVSRPGAALSRPIFYKVPACRHD
jgi:cathepsin B